MRDSHIPYSDLPQVNLLVPMRLTRRLAPAMIEREKGGYIINISSVAGLDAMPGIGGYNAAKFGFTGWAKSTQQVDHFTHDSKNCCLS
jgi:short-subunit dehydrogenase